MVVGLRLKCNIQKRQIGRTCVTVNLPQQAITKEILFAMNTVTQKMKFRQFLIKYSMKYGVTKSAIKYDVTRQYICFRNIRYGGTLQSPEDRSLRP